MVFLVFSLVFSCCVSVFLGILLFLIYHLCQFLNRNYHSITESRAISCYSLFPPWECKQTWLLLNFVPTIDFTSSQFPADEKRQYQHISSFRWCIYHIVFFLVMYGPAAFRLWRWDMIETETKGLGRSVKYNTLNKRLLICTLNFVQDPRYCCRRKKLIHWKGINKHTHTRTRTYTLSFGKQDYFCYNMFTFFKIRNSKKSLLAHVNCAEIFCTANVCSTAWHFSIKFLRFRK